MPADVGGGGESWAGPSESEWQQTQEALAGQQSALAEIAGLFAPEPDEPQGFDPFDENFDERLRGYVSEQLAPIAETFQELQQQARLASASEHIAGLIDGHAAALGIDAGDAAEVDEPRSTPWRDWFRWAWSSAACSRTRRCRRWRRVRLRR